MSKTFNEARKFHLKALDAAFYKLREIAAKPDWCNEMWPPYKAAMEDLTAVLRHIRELNAAADLALEDNDEQKPPFLEALVGLHHSQAQKSVEAIGLKWRLAKINATKWEDPRDYTITRVNARVQDGIVKEVWLG